MSSLIFLYVYDLIISGRQLVLIQNMKSDLQKNFEMNILGILHYFLGLHILHMVNGFFSARFHMSDCKPAPTPFHPSVKLIVKCAIPLVGATLYR